MIGLTPAQRIQAILAACAVATAPVVAFEGWRTKTYLDPVAIPTACAGVTGGVKRGATYTDAECEVLTAQALVAHGLAIAPCAPDDLPTDTRAAFISFAYNVGAAKFCSSTLSRKAKAGDLRGACDELLKWINAGGRPLPGLITRRAAERQLCLRGLA